jgi:hypothetical protein
VTGVCGYCGAHGPVAFTGRRWLCHQCWAENLGEPFPDADRRIGSETTSQSYLAGLTNPTTHSTPIGTTD